MVLAELDVTKCLADSAADEYPEPILCAYVTGTLMVKKDLQLPEFGDPAFQNR